VFSHFARGAEVQNNDVCAKNRVCHTYANREYVRAATLYECIYILLLLQRCYVNDIVKRERRVWRELFMRRGLLTPSSPFRIYLFVPPKSDSNLLLSQIFTPHHCRF
jgi:hypothetical protein